MVLMAAGSAAVIAVLESANSQWFYGEFLSVCLSGCLFLAQIAHLYIMQYLCVSLSLAVVCFLSFGHVSLYCGAISVAICCC